jgi:GTPase SAR1 family protein
MENYSNGLSNSMGSVDLTPKKEVHVLKFVILGDSNVGKTSILHHFMFNKCKNLFLKF